MEATHILSNPIVLGKDGRKTMMVMMVMVMIMMIMMMMMMMKCLYQIQIGLMTRKLAL